MREFATKMIFLLQGLWDYLDDYHYSICEQKGKQDEANDVEGIMNLLMGIIYILKKYAKKT